MAVILKEGHKMGCYSFVACYDGKEKVYKDFLFDFYAKPFPNVGLAKAAIVRKLRKEFGKDVDYSEIELNLSAIARSCPDFFFDYLSDTKTADQDIKLIEAEIEMDEAEEMEAVRQSWL